jgi:hypothetical protein
MSILVGGLIALAVMVVIFLIVVSFQPAKFRVVRAATISGRPGAVFPHVNDLRKWQAWSPWAKIDAAMKHTYTGAAAGTGAVSEWSGNKKVDAGRMTITESRTDQLVQIRLEFFRPFKPTNNAGFDFTPQGPGDQTEVT